VAGVGCVVSANPSIVGMSFSWDDSRTAFADAAGWFVRTTALADGAAGPLLLAATGRPAGSGQRASRCREPPHRDPALTGQSLPADTVTATG